MFARAARRPGTPAYIDYYQRHPELQRIDDRIREAPALCQPGGRYYQPELARETERFFEQIHTIAPDELVVERLAERFTETRAPETTLQQFALELGAVAAGCTTVPEAFVYTTKGRFDADYGDLVPTHRTSAVVFLVEMEHAAMVQAPRAPVILESARQYYRSAVIALTIEAALRRAGHDAKAQYDAHYQVILPPLAELAGLGQVGRNNILVADRFGSRVRIGAVTMELDLKPSRRVDLGVDSFCGACKKCAENCPSKSLSLGDKELVRGHRIWPTRAEGCYGYWRHLGTDCGICMAVCPFSHRASGLHQVMRGIVRHTSTQRLALWLDDRVYGRTWDDRRCARRSWL